MPPLSVASPTRVTGEAKLMVLPMIVDESDTAPPPLSVKAPFAFTDPVSDIAPVWVIEQGPPLLVFNDPAKVKLVPVIWIPPEE